MAASAQKAAIGYINVVGSASESSSEFELLDSSNSTRAGRTVAGDGHDIVTAPLLTRGALLASGLCNDQSQYGLLGQVLGVHSKDRVNKPEDPRIYMNTNAPLSALVCGVQGSGKSHTVASILENMLIPGDQRIGRLSKPLCGLVLHMSDGGLQSSPNEAAWLGLPTGKNTKVPGVDIFVSPSSLNTMKAVYGRLGKAVNVKPLYFTEDELDAQAFLSMMAVESTVSAPLYVQIILSILRELGESYSYQAFKQKLEEKQKDFNPAQKAGLKQRMALLESFLSKDRSMKVPERRFSGGRLTIIDLSDPFIDSASACGIFEIITRLFVRAEVNTGKIIVVDEAHKYLSATDSASGLTKSLLTMIREQRHKGIRIIISTQEPTVVPPVLIDLCTVTIMHRFSSPAWYNHVLKHVCADMTSDAFDKIVKLNTGEAIVLAPTGLCVYIDGQGRVIGQCGRRFMHVRMRRRITEDGGASVLVV